MSEITKLYENAGVSKEPAIIPSSGEVIYWKNYPPFTSEKQIELIKWLGSNHGVYIVGKYSIGFGECIGDFCIKEDFEEALAGSTNSLWQDLTEEEKEALRGILRA